MADSNRLWWKGWVGRVLTSSPVQASHEWVKKAIERLDSNQDPEDILKRKEQVLDRQIKHYGVDGGPTANARGAVALQLQRMGRLVEARVLWEEAAAAYRRNRGPDDPYTLGYEERLAVNLTKSQLWAEARPLMTHICDVRLRTLGPEDEHTQRAQRRLSLIDQHLAE